MDYFIKCLKMYATFSGRARRKEYWMFVLFQMIFTYGVMGIGAATKSNVISMIGGILPLVFFVTCNCSWC